MKPLNEKQLQQENRQGIIQFTIETLFDLALLKNDIIPISIYKNNRNDTYQLNCLSPSFDKVGKLSPTPFYQVTFERNEEQLVSLKEIKRV